MVCEAVETLQFTVAFFLIIPLKAWHVRHGANASLLASTCHGSEHGRSRGLRIIDCSFFSRERMPNQDAPRILAEETSDQVRSWRNIGGLNGRSIHSGGTLSTKGGLSRSCELLETFGRDVQCGTFDS